MPSNVFIRNLALTDLLIGLLILPVMIVSISNQRSWKLSSPGCQLHGILVRSHFTFCVFKIKLYFIDIVLKMHLFSSVFMCIYLGGSFSERIDTFLDWDSNRQILGCCPTHLLQG